MSLPVRRLLTAVAAASIVSLCAGRAAAQAPAPGKLYVFGGCLKGISGEGATQNAWEWDPVAKRTEEVLCVC